MREQRAAVLDAVVAHQQVEIVPERLGEFRLGVEQIHDPQVGREPSGLGARKSPALTPRRCRVGPQRSRQLSKSAAAARMASAVMQRIARGAGLAAPIGRRPAPEPRPLPGVETGGTTNCQARSGARTAAVQPARQSAIAARRRKRLGHGHSLVTEFLTPALPGTATVAHPGAVHRIPAQPLSIHRAAT